MSNFKSMQPCDAFLDRVTFPCIVQAKIDGTAAYNRHGNLVGRSLKPHENTHTTQTWSVPELHGFCGEMTTGSDPTGNDLCRITSGDLRRHEGQPDIYWWIFDYCTDATKDLPYTDRMCLAYEAFDSLSPDLQYLAAKIKFIPSTLVQNMEELLALEQKYLDMGYEGIIIRDPKAPFKYGRCGKTFMGAWRVKRFIDAEAIVTSIEEGRTNQNEAKTNLLGRTERSTMQENMLPNGLVGNLQGKVLKDVLDPQTKQVLLYAGQEITISPGKMPHDLRKFYFENQSEIVGKISKFKFFPKGHKDKPRFPTWETLRSEVDMGD